MSKTCILRLALSVRSLLYQHSEGLYQWTPELSCLFRPLTPFLGPEILTLQCGYRVVMWGTTDLFWLFQNYVGFQFATVLIYQKTCKYTIIVISNFSESMLSNTLVSLDPKAGKHLLQLNPYLHMSMTRGPHVMSMFSAVHLHRIRK